MPRGQCAVFSRGNNAVEPSNAATVGSSGSLCKPDGRSLQDARGGRHDLPRSHRLGLPFPGSPTVSVQLRFPRGSWNLEHRPRPGLWLFKPRLKLDCVQVSIFQLKANPDCFALQPADVRGRFPADILLETVAPQGIAIFDLETL